MIIGIGVDIVDIRRIEKLYAAQGENFLRRILSSKEIERFKEILDAQVAISFVSKRFASKEAVSKAFGVGIGELSFCDIEVLNNASGAPYVILPEEFLKRYETSEDEGTGVSGAVKVHISISDEYPMACSFVTIERL